MSKTVFDCVDWHQTFLAILGLAAAAMVAPIVPLIAAEAILLDDQAPQIDVESLILTLFCLASLFAIVPVGLYAGWNFSAIPGFLYLLGAEFWMWELLKTEI